MVRYYCPNCWGEFWEKLDNCPECGYNIKDYDKKDYTEKIIIALNHKVGELRHRAIMILTLKKEKKALPYLESILQRAKDPLLKRAAQESIEKIKMGS